MPRTVLPIAPRLQWNNGHGYCGETAVQACGLFYGSYFSCDQVRKAAGSELLVGENANKALDFFGFSYQQFDNEIQQPQYKRYLQWAKEHIVAGNPVIVTGYAQQQHSDQYDHIYLAVGVEYQQLETYSDDDKLIYMTFFEEDLQEDEFGRIWDTRAMAHNGKDLDFAIPRDVDYGIAITGLEHQGKARLWLELGESRQPNVTQGEAARELAVLVCCDEDVVVTRTEGGAVSQLVLKKNEGRFEAEDVVLSSSIVNYTS